MGNLGFRRVQHVSLTRPVHSEEAARAFYGGLLGLTEIERPRALSHMDLIWYAIGDDELHLVAEDNPVNTGSGRHLCMQLSDLPALRRALEAQGYPIEDPVAIPGRPRFFCRDPFGNNIEFTVLEGDFRTLQDQ